MRYTISTQVWTIYDYPTLGVIHAMGSVQLGTAKFICAVPYSGNSYKLLRLDAPGVGTDDTKPIYFDYIDRWRSYTDMYSKAKSISGASVLSVNGAGTNMLYQSIKSYKNGVWDELGTLTEEYASLFPNASSNDFSVSRLRLTGSSIGEPIIIDGIELLTIQDKGFDKN